MLKELGSEAAVEKRMDILTQYLKGDDDAWTDILLQAKTVVERCREMKKSATSGIQANC